MKPNQLPAFLSRQPLFRGLSADEIAVVASRMTIRNFSDGEQIFAEGVVGEAWYVVVRGAVVITKAVATGGDHELARLEKGEEFGEMALLDDSPRLATATADGVTTLACLSRTAFDALLVEHGTVGARVVLAMARVLCQRQRELTAILTDLVDDPETAAPGPREMLSLLLVAAGMNTGVHEPLPD